MKDNNVCKFVPPSFPNTLLVSCFVLESDNEVMKKPFRLKENRLVLIVKGSGRMNIDQGAVLYDAGTLIFVFKDEEFSVSQKEKTEYLYIGFSGNRADDLFLRFGINKDKRYFGGFDGLIPLWRESLSRASHETVDLVSESMLLYTFSRLLAATPKKNDTLDQIIKLTEQHFNDPDLSIGEIAAELGYNPKYLSSMFKEKMGVGYSDYLRTLRIKYAVSLFDNGIDSVKNVALLSGYTDPLYFSTVFKTAVGVSPKDYKNNLKK